MKLLSEVKCFGLSNRGFDITRENEGNHANVKSQQMYCFIYPGATS